MEKKWLKDPRTRSLQFTDRWIIGILKRSESPASVAAGIVAVEGGDALLQTSRVSHPALHLIKYRLALIRVVDCLILFK